MTTQGFAGDKRDFGVCGETKLSMFTSACAKTSTNTEKNPRIIFCICLKWLIHLYGPG